MKIKINIEDLIESFPVGISITTPAGETIECNSEAFKIFGYNSKIDFLKVPVLNHYCNPEDRTKFLTLAESGTLNDFEVKLKKKDGSIFWASISSTIQQLEDQTLLINSFQDITKRKAIEDSLKESEEKFRTITEQLFMNISIIQDGLFKYFNERFLKTNGYSIEEIKNWEPYEFSKLIYPEDREFVMEQARKKQAGEKDIVIHYKYRLIRKDGKIRWLENFSKTIQYEGRPADLIMSIDITDNIEAEQKLKESEENYREAYNRADFYKDLFAHDMSNILQNIRSSIELSAMWVNDQKRKQNLNELFDLIKEQTERGSSLISNVRKLSSIDDGIIEIRSIDLKKVLNNAIENVHSRFPTSEFSIKVDYPDDSLTVLAGDLLIDVFENILINAALHNKHNHKELIIRISKIIENNIQYLKIEHLDNGIGIRDDLKQIIFDKSYKKDKNSRGMGIGLSLVKKILDGYKGKIWIEDRIEGNYEKGSNFIIMLKIA
ncbi:MAG: PAS domain S-box protein [Promethearchaeota archaeon]